MADSRRSSVGSNRGTRCRNKSRCLRQGITATTASLRKPGRLPHFLDYSTERDMTDDDRNAIRKLLEGAKREYQEIGGWDAFKSGEWLLILIQRSFRDYWERATVEYFCEKYGTNDPAKISAKLISVASKNSAMLGAVTGAAVSADEIVAVVTAAEGGIGLPANLAIAGAALSAEAITLVRFQMQLVANLGKLYGVPLDPDDPENILTILAFALGGSAAEVAGKAGAKIGGRLGGRAAKAVFSKDLLKAVQRIGAKVGVKILQRTIVKYVVPIVSIGIGTGWNYVATQSVGRVAISHFKGRLADQPESENLRSRTGDGHSVHNGPRVASGLVVEADAAQGNHG